MTLKDLLKQYCLERPISLVTSNSYGYAIYEHAPVEQFQQIIDSEFCPMTPNQLLDHLRRTVPNLDELHNEAAAANYRTSYWCHTNAVDRHLDDLFERGE